MSKKNEKNNSTLPSLPYVNSNRLEEAQNKILLDKNFIEKLKEEIYTLKYDIANKDKQYMNSTRIYDKLLDDKSQEVMQLEEELKKIKSERQDHQQKLFEEFEDKISVIKENYENKNSKLIDEIDKYREKHRKAKIVKKELREDIEGYKKELEVLNVTKNKQIQILESKIKEIQELHIKELSEMKRKEEEFLKSNEELMDTDLYVVYKEIKKNCENKISDLIEYKAKNEKISDENKLFKLNFENSEKIIKECSLVQVNQKKLIKQLQVELKDKTDLLRETREEFERHFREMTIRYEDIIQQKENELKRNKEILKQKSKENYQLKSLSQMILDQRSEIEMFFIESLEEVKMEIYKRKKEFEKKNKSFPHLNKKYEDNTKKIETHIKVDVKELTPEDREKVLRVLFGKINENYQPKSYKNYDLRQSKESNNNSNNESNIQNVGIISHTK